ncbi:Lrp/AsnC family transcriptional regulator [Streptomyces albulus]|nr:Lrp/AsnC family transcriptional regulator [Streptomyces noursei]
MDSDITAGAVELLDELDHAVIRLLAREPRAAFADVGARLGVHERTVARRLDRLIAAGLVRFTAFLVPEHLGEGLVVELAVRCAPAGCTRRRRRWPGGRTCARWTWPPARPRWSPR